MILVTGGTGFLGRHITNKLLECGEQVRVLVRPSSFRENLKGLQVEFIEGDLRDIGSLRNAVKNVSLVYHVAADYRLIALNPQELYDNNVQGTINLLTACQNSNVLKIVHTSSVSTIGIPKDGAPGTEESPVTIIDMVGHYKKSKFLAEQEVFKFIKQGMPIVIVNPSTPVGPHDHKPTSTGQIILDYICGRMPVYVDTGLNLIDAEDVAWGHILAAQKGQIGEKYILGNKNMTLKEIFDSLEKITGIPSPKVKIPISLAYGLGIADTFISRFVLKKDPRIPLEGVKMARKKMFFSAQKAIKELGLPQNSVEAALEKSVKWFLDNGYIKDDKINCKLQN